MVSIQEYKISLFLLKKPFKNSFRTGGDVSQQDILSQRYQ